MSAAIVPRRVVGDGRDDVGDAGLRAVDARQVARVELAGLGAVARGGDDPLAAPAAVPR